MNTQKFHDVGKWFVTIIGIKADAPSYVASHFKIPVRVQVRNNIFNPPSPVIVYPTEDHLWWGDFFIYKKSSDEQT